MPHKSGNGETKQKEPVKKKKRSLKQMFTDPIETLKNKSIRELERQTKMAKERK